MLKNEKQLVRHLEELLKEIRDPYPGFVRSIMNLMGHLSDEQFTGFIKWIEKNPDLSTDDICDEVAKLIDNK